MKFLLYLEENWIPEWSVFYIDYACLKKFLDDMKAKYKKYKGENAAKRRFSSFDTNALVEQGDENFITASREFHEELIIQLNKVFHFIVENMNYYNKRVIKFSKQLRFIAENDSMRKYKPTLELAIKEMYKELNNMRNFILLH